MDGIADLSRFNPNGSSHLTGVLPFNKLFEGIPGFTHRAGTTRLTIADPVVLDRFFIMSDEHHDEYVAKHNLNGQEKKQPPIHEFFRVQEDLMSYYEPEDKLGGSGATIARTLKKLMGSSIDIAYISVLDNSPESLKLREQITEDGIRFYNYNLHPSLRPKRATSLVLVSPNRGRTIITDPGTFGQTLAPTKSDGSRDLSLLKDGNLIRDTDALYMLFSNRHPSRLGPEFIDEMLKQSEDKIRIANLSTNLAYASEPENVAFFRREAHKIDLQMSNAEELRAVYGDPGEEALYREERKKFKQKEKDRQEEGSPLSEKEKFQAKKWFSQWERTLNEIALYACQKNLNDHYQESAARAQWHGRDKAVVVTDDLNPAYVMQPVGNQDSHNIQQVYPRPVPTEDYEGNIGCGDTVMGVMTETYLKRENLVRGLERSMFIAGENARQLGACLDDPKTAYHRGAPALAAQRYCGPHIPVLREPKKPLAERIRRRAQPVYDLAAG